jgi:hypothetical protein
VRVVVADRVAGADVGFTDDRAEQGSRVEHGS